jgi:hypothetical protein
MDLAIKYDKKKKPRSMAGIAFVAITETLDGEGDGLWRKYLGSPYWMREQEC